MSVLRNILACAACVCFLLSASSVRAETKRPLTYLVQVYPGNWQPPFQAFFNDHLFA